MLSVSKSVTITLPRHLHPPGPRRGLSHREQLSWEEIWGVLQALGVLAWLKPLSPFMLLQSPAWEEAANLSLSLKVQPVDSLKIS